MIPRFFKNLKKYSLVGEKLADSVFNAQQFKNSKLKINFKFKLKMKFEIEFRYKITG